MNADCRLPDGFVLHVFDRVESTNDEAKRLAEARAPSGQVVVAAAQTRGRGRYARSWSSPPGNLYASVLLRPRRPVAQTAQISLVAGLAMAEAIERFGPADRAVTLKWPNDVLLGDAKTAGLLLESGGGAGRGRPWLVVGSGVNIVSFPEDVPYPATCLRREGFAPGPTPLGLLEAYVWRLDDWLTRWRRLGFADVRRAWLARSHHLGEAIRLRLAHEEVHGRFVDLTQSGALLLEEAGGGRREIAAGDVFYGSS